jgi:nicotinamide-nucleotide adenylyltransferase
MRRVLFPGRFQPFHYGHLSVIKWALERFDEIVILIGSAQESHTLYNPFTAGERVEMIYNALEEESLYKKVFLFPLMESISNKNWIHEVELISPRFDSIITGNPLVVTSVRDTKYEIVIPKQFNREKYNSTLIRNMILKGEDWKSLVPYSVYEFIKKIHGDERIIDLSKSDKASDD